MSYVVGLPSNSGFAPGCVNYKKDALDSQLQVIKFTSCLSMVGGSLQILRLSPPLKLVTESGLKHNKSNQINPLVVRVGYWEGLSEIA